MSDTRQPVVLVTGASSGIGKACAEHLAGRGFRVFGTQRRPPEGGHGAVEMIAMDVDDDALGGARRRAVSSSAPDGSTRW